MHSSEVTGTGLTTEQSLEPGKCAQLISVAVIVKDALVKPSLKGKDD